MREVPAREDELRPQRERAPVARLRFLEPVQRRVRAGEREMDLRRLRADGGRLLERRGRFRGPVELAQHQAEIRERRHDWPPRRRAQHLLRGVELAELAQHRAEIDLGDRVAGADLERLAVGGRCFGRATEALEHDRVRDPRIGVVRRRAQVRREDLFGGRRVAGVVQLHRPAERVGGVGHRFIGHRSAAASNLHFAPGSRQPSVHQPAGGTHTR